MSDSRIRSRLWSALQQIADDEGISITSLRAEWIAASGLDSSRSILMEVEFSATAKAQHQPKENKA